MLANYEAVRDATLSLMATVAPEAWLGKGIASNTTLSARALAYVIAGHELHHLNLIRNRYLQNNQ